MLQRTNRILIGKDIDRDAQVVDGATLATITLSSGLADGEIVVLDKYKKALANGATIADTDIIYICQGTAETFSYTNEAGSTITGARKIIISDPIEGAKVKKVTFNTYTQKAERTAACNLTGLTPVVGTEYIIRIIYTDMVEHPGQFTQTYRVIATTATLKDLVDAFTAKINAHKGRRVVSSDNDATITLTGLAIPECTTGLNDIDEFNMVNFVAKFLYVNSAGNWAVMPSTSTAVTYTGPTFGSGNWEQIRDIEKGALGYSGVTNTWHWPTKVPTMSTVVGKTYDMIVIEHDRSYLSPDNQYIKQAPLTTVLAFEVQSSGNQQGKVQIRLNSWLESLDKGIPTITIVGTTTIA
jgi:hypothetical protein